MSETRDLTEHPGIKAAREADAAHHAQPCCDECERYARLVKHVTELAQQIVAATRSRV